MESNATNSSTKTCDEQSTRQKLLARAASYAFAVTGGIVIGTALGSVSPLTTARLPSTKKVTPVSACRTQCTARPGPLVVSKTAQANAWAYLRGKMPRAGFTGLQPDPYVPGLLHVETGKPNDPVFFDPREHALIIGLVVNLNNPTMPIAPGVSLPQGLIR